MYSRITRTFRLQRQSERVTQQRQAGNQSSAGTLGRSEGDVAASMSWRRRAAWVVGGYLAAVGFAAAYALVLQRAGDWATGFDWEIALLRRIHFEVPRWVDAIFLTLPWFGTNITLLPILLIAAAWLWRMHRRDLAVHLFVVQMGSFTLTPLLKAMYERPRPQLWEHRGQFAWAAYPSGHAIATVAVLFTVALLLHRERGWRWPIAAASVLTLVSLYSRLYLGVHWPTDVVAGVLMGAIWLIATLIAFSPAASDGSSTRGGTDLR